MDAHPVNMKAKSEFEMERILLYIEAKTSFKTFNYSHIINLRLM
jgi:hypothetical protein